eukprot:1557973-Rhodomonas_salina.3
MGWLVWVSQSPSPLNLIKIRPGAVGLGSGRGVGELELFYHRHPTSGLGPDDDPHLGPFPSLEILLYRLSRCPEKPS